MTIRTLLAGALIEALFASSATLASAAVPALPSLLPDNAASTALTPAPSANNVLHIQVLLDRRHFSPGEIDATSGGNTRLAIAAFQSAHDLPASGVVDAATWALLHHDDGPILSSYTVTAADVAGPFAALPADMMEKSKLSALGYTSSAEALGERFHASPALLRQLNPGNPLDRAGDEIVVPNVTGLPLAAAAKVLVDRSDASVSLLDSAGKVIARFPATTGSKHDPLPAGDWLIQGIAKNPVFNYNPDLFWDADPDHSKAKIAPGPNNPVGLVWVGLSKPHYGIHGTPEPRLIGKTQSHGCIRLSNWNATALADAVTTGMSATLQD